MKRAAAITLVLAFASHAQELSKEDVINVRQATILLPDAGVVGVLGGAWLSDAKTMALAKERASLKAEVKALEESPPVSPTIVAFLVGIAIGGIAGAVIAVKLGGK